MMESGRIEKIAAARMAEVDASVGLKVIDKGTALDAVNAFLVGNECCLSRRDDHGDYSCLDEYNTIPNPLESGVEQ